MLLSICVDQCQEDDDGQQSSQNRGAIRIKISIFLIVLDGFRSDVVPKGRNHASQAKNSQQSCRQCHLNVDQAMTSTAMGAMKYPALEVSPSNESKPREREVSSTPACIHCRYVLSFAKSVFGSTFLERCTFVGGGPRFTKKRLMGFGIQD